MRPGRSAKGEVLVWSRACERLTGLPASEVLGTTDHWPGFYEAPRPCLADLVLHGTSGEIGTLYEEHGPVVGTAIGGLWWLQIAS